MENIKQGDRVGLTADIINVYDNGTVRIQLRPSLACIDVKQSDLVELGGPASSSGQTVAGEAGNDNPPGEQQDSEEQAA